MQGVCTSVSPAVRSFLGTHYFSFGFPAYFEYWPVYYTLREWLLRYVGKGTFPAAPALTTASNNNIKYVKGLSRGVLSSAKILVLKWSS